MTYSLDTTIKGPSRGAVGPIYEWAQRNGCQRPADVLAYLTTMHKLCVSHGLRFEVLVSQSIHETSVNGSPWASAWWVSRCNPAGIGITGDPRQNNASRDFGDGEGAARAHFTHVWLYAIGTDLPTGLSPQDDPRWDAAVSAGYAGVAPTMRGFTRRWGMDPFYSNSWLNRLNALEPIIETEPIESGPPMTEQLNFDPKLVPLPGHTYQVSTRKVNGIGMNYLGDRVFRGIVFHRAVSGNQTFQAAIDWLLNPSVGGLTDGFIDHRTGKMVFINPMKALHPASKLPSGYRDRAGWAQGPYRAAEASNDGRAFRNRYGGRLGADIINQDLESMEITGNYDYEITEACKQTLAQWTASRAQLLKIPWRSFPINPADGLTMIYGHREFCGTRWKLCPGWVVWQFINGELIDRVRVILKAAQTSGKPIEEPTPIYATRDIPTFLTNWNGEPKVEDANGVVYFVTDAQYVATEPAAQLKWAEPDSPKVDTDTPAGEDANFAFVFTHKGEEWGMRPDGTRQMLKHFKVVGDAIPKAA